MKSYIIYTSRAVSLSRNSSIESVALNEIKINADDVHLDDCWMRFFKNKNECARFALGEIIGYELLKEEKDGN